MNSPDVIVIGVGPSGIALAHTLKHRLGFNDFTVRHKEWEKRIGQKRKGKTYRDIVLRQIGWPGWNMETKYIPRGVRTILP